MAKDNELWNSYLNGKGEFGNDGEWFNYPIGKTFQVPRDPNLIPRDIVLLIVAPIETLAYMRIRSEKEFPYLKN